MHFSQMNSKNFVSPIFFLSHQIQRPLSEIGSLPHGSSPQRKGSTLRLSFSEEEDREDVDELKKTYVCTSVLWMNKNK